MLVRHQPTDLSASTLDIIAAASGSAVQQASASAVQIVLNFPPVVGYDGLSRLLGRTVQTLQADRCRNPASVPPASTPPGSRTPLWVVAEVIAWLQQHRESGARQATSKRRKAGPGAPTKAEKIAASEVGLSVKEWRALQKEGGAQ